MRFEDLTAEILRRALAAYLAEAYPEGMPDRVRIPRSLVEEPTTAGTEAVLAEFVDEARRDGACVNHRWVLRLGNDRYPFMKFVIQEYMLEGEYVFAVDTHDAMDIRPSMPDYEEWMALRHYNSALCARIEARWRAEDLDTCARLADKVRSCRAQVPGRGAGRRVLVVDDERDLAEAFAGLLRGEGYEVEIAATGTQGIERALERRPDLVILDYELPERDGLEVLTQLRSHAETRTLPVVLASASVLSLEKIRRASGFLAKPCSAEVLLGVCAHQLAAAALPQGLPTSKDRTLQHG